MIPSTAASQQIVEKYGKELGVAVGQRLRRRRSTAPAEARHQGRSLKAAGNMPGGWLMWMLEQYGHQPRDREGPGFRRRSQREVRRHPSALRHLPGPHRQRPRPKRNDPAEWSWAFGVGEDGWKKLKKFVENGGTLLAIGSAVETARELLDLPIEEALPGAPRFAASAVGRVGQAAMPRAARCVHQPARLMQTLRDRVADPESLFYCPGSLLKNEFDPNNPWRGACPCRGRCSSRATRRTALRPGFGVETKVVSRYPHEEVLASGWLLGEEY